MVIPLTDQTDKQVTDALLDQYIKVFGIPSVIITDNGSCFTSQKFTNLCKILDIHHKKTTAYHPQSNGLLERQHRKLKDSIRCLGNINLDWDILIPMIQLAWNNAAIHNNVYSPNQLVFGQELVLPNELFRRQHNLEMQQTTPSNSNIEKFMQAMFELQPLESKSKASPIKLFRLNDLDKAESVFIKDQSQAHKLLPVYKGPYKVLERFEAYYVIEMRGKPYKVSILDVKPSYKVDVEQQHQPLVIRDEPLLEQVNKMSDARRLAQKQLKLISETIEERIKGYRELNIANPIEIDKIKDWIKKNPKLAQQQLDATKSKDS